MEYIIIFIVVTAIMFTINPVKFELNDKQKMRIANALEQDRQQVRNQFVEMIGGVEQDSVCYSLPCEGGFSTLYFLDYNTPFFGYWDYDIQKVYRLPLSDITDVVVSEGQTTSQTVTRGGIKRAVIGGAIAGGAGAIVGANTARRESIQTSHPLVIVYTHDIEHSAFVIPATDMTNAIQYQSKIIAIKNKYQNCPPPADLSMA